MGRHSKWRKEAKKMRRKWIRQQVAQKREATANAELTLLEQSPRYQTLAAEQRALEMFQEEEEERQEIIRHQQWLRSEEIAQQQFVLQQERRVLAREEKIKQDKLIRIEWEAEQAKLKTIADEKKKIEDEKTQKHEELMRKIDDFIKKGGDLPLGINVSTETNPGKPLCPFFSKTGACRFGDRCSRNHVRPGISKVLLIPSFYSHFGMSQSMAVEYDTDLMLEYEDSETYQDFKEFYDDVLPELEEYGDVVQFKVCCNYEPHLRGNVYVEYTSERYAVKAYQKFHGRYYGGRQLNMEFTCVTSWKSALCGMFFKKLCPKGRSCNFLHVFRNPNNRFSNADRDMALSSRSRLSSRSHHRSPSWSTARSPSRSDSRSHQGQRDRGHWRWSESPPPALPNRRESKRETSRRRRDVKRDATSSKRERTDSDRQSRRDEDRNGHSTRSTRSSSGRSSSSKASHRKERKQRSRSRS